MAIQIDDKFKDVLVEVLDDYLYRVSLELNALKGQPMTSNRKDLTKNQRKMEELRNLLLVS